MNREQIVKMAREAGADCVIPSQLWCDAEYVMTESGIERFAAAIRASTKEEDAKICEELGKPHSFQSIAESINTEIASKQIAAAIRASK